MAENEKDSLLGRKIFFLHPSAFVQNQVISELAQEEFEVYVIKDESKIRNALKKHPDSILFASINETLKESAWVELIQALQKSPDTAGIDIGIIASSGDEDAKRKYSGLLTLPCGYTVIKSDLNTATKQLATALNSVNAKGRRKYIRMIIDRETNATINLPLDGTYINGSIKDISVVGFSCAFPEDPGLKKNGLFGDMQLRLQSQLLKAEGIVFGSRHDDPEEVYVLLFSQRIDPSVRSKIRKFIQTYLQHRMDEELK
jgi:hypothetical protein